MIKTVIINPDRQDRDKINSLLAIHRDIKVAALGKDGYDALKLIGSMRPDIAIIDNQLEFIMGEEIPPLIKTRSPGTAVVILVTKISDYQLYRAASNEIAGLVNKETDMEILHGILRCIYEGGCFISPSFAARVLQLLAANRALVEKPFKSKGNSRFPSQEDPTGYLSKMELRILTCIAEGNTSNEIAKKLDLVVGTVRNYISSIMRKTGMHNRSQLTRYAFYYGLI